MQACLFLDVSRYRFDLVVFLGVASMFLGGSWSGLLLFLIFCGWVLGSCHEGGSWFGFVMGFFLTPPKPYRAYTPTRVWHVNVRVFYTPPKP